MAQIGSYPNASSLTGGKLIGTDVDGETKNFPATMFATGAQGTLAGTALQPGDSADDLVDGTTNKFLLAAERTKIGHLTVTQAVSLDTMESKLDGIEALADVTDAGNIASSINGTSAKVTLVDGDYLPIINSESSNALGRTLLSSLKAWSKAYTDTLYAPIVHSHTFASLTSKPTTLSGYGITDAQGLNTSLTQIAGLADPNADRLLFWDDSAGAYTYLTVGTNLSISGTTLNASGGGGGGGGDMDTAIYDPNAVASDAFDMDNMVEGTTTKILTAAERAKVGHLTVTQAVDLDAIETKVDGIEALADVTDAGNVGSSIHGATAKTTPVDADTMALIDSAASNVLKKLTWANLKATAKTYFDGLYQPLLATLTSWGAITRASGFDTFVATPSSANLRSLLTDETGTGAAVFASAPTLTDPAIVGTILEDIYTISDGAAFEIDPGNGSEQFITLGANRTPAATNFADGESVVLHVADGAAYTITWTTVGVVWVGGPAPTLATTGYTVIVLWKAGGVIRGTRVGDVAS